MRVISCLLLPLIVGCSPSDAGKSPKGSSPASPAVVGFADSPAKRMTDEIAWFDRAAELLPKVVDRASADAHANELVSLVRDKETLTARFRQDKVWDWPKEKKEALEKEYGALRIKAAKRYADAAHPFDNSSARKDLVPYIIERHGVDIRRMKSSKKCRRLRSAPMGYYPNGVRYQSPGSRSAPWARGARGCVPRRGSIAEIDRLWNPFGGQEVASFDTQGALRDPGL